MESENNKVLIGENNSNKDNFKFFDWLILIFGMFVLPGAIMSLLSDAPIFLIGGSHFLSFFLDIIFLALGILALKNKLKKFKSAKTSRAYKILIIFIYVIAILIIVPAILSFVIALDARGK